MCKSEGDRSVPDGNIIFELGMVAGALPGSSGFNLMRLSLLGANRVVAILDE